MRDTPETDYTGTEHHGATENNSRGRDDSGSRPEDRVSFSDLIMPIRKIPRFAILLSASRVHSTSILPSFFLSFMLLLFLMFLDQSNQTLQPFTADTPALSLIDRENFQLAHFHRSTYRRSTTYSPSFRPRFYRLTLTC